MAKPYSMDLRERAVRRVAAGESAHSVAAVVKVSVSSVIKWAQRLRRTGSVAPGKMGGQPLRVSGEHRTWLLARVAGDPNVTLRSLARELGERGIKVCQLHTAKDVEVFDVACDATVEDGQGVFDIKRSNTGMKKRHLSSRTRWHRVKVNRNRPQFRRPPCKEALMH